MTDTSKPGTLAEALALLQADLPDVRKDETASVTSERTGKTFTYAYADLADCAQAIMPKMGPLGLSFTAFPTINEHGFVLHYELLHSAGDIKPGDYPLPDPRDPQAKVTPQALGSAITYARRHALCAVTGLAPDKDDDAQAAQKPAKQQRQTRPADTPTVSMSRSRNGNGHDRDLISSDQLKKLHASFGDIGVTDRDEKVAYAQRGIHGRKLESTKELTKAEATKLIDHLAGLVEPAPEEVPADG